MTERVGKGEKESMSSALVGVSTIGNGMLLTLPQRCLSQCASSSLSFVFC